VRDRGNKNRVRESMVIGAYCIRSTWEVSFSGSKTRIVLSGKSSVIRWVFCKRERERGRGREGERESVDTYVYDAYICIYIYFFELESARAGKRKSEMIL